MITRQTLETFRHSFELQLQQEQANFHTVQGGYQEFVDNEYNKFMEEFQKAGPKTKSLMKDEFERKQAKYTKKQHELNTALERVIRTETAQNVVQNLIDQVDTAEMDTEIKTEMLRVVDGKIAEALRGEEGIGCKGETIEIS